MSPGAQKLAWAGLAVCAFAAAAFVPLVSAQAGLLGIGSYILGKITSKRPGDVPEDSPKVPPAAAAAVLFAFSSGCAQFSQIHWPDFAECGKPAADVVAGVLKILLDEAKNGEGITESGRRKMAALAKQYGPQAVACAVAVAQKQAEDKATAQAAEEFLTAMRNEP